jgi:predicted pyridoxine 5'-phosphate oxidase superfamily flavin-nucleotide-binding protein
MLTNHVKEYIDRSVLCWLATVDRLGRPNVSPKEIFSAFGDSDLVIANIASPSSVRNLRGNPHACVSFIDVFVQKGYKLLGRAEVIEASDVRFSELAAPLLEMTKGIFPILSVIRLTVEEVTPIVAPSYIMVAKTTEESQVQSAMKRYGVLRQEADQDPSR